MAQWADGAVRPDYDRTREPLEVFALNGKMQRVSGSIPYTSLQWCRRYYESGTFTMAVPANVYDPSWRYIYTDSRYETGMIQKVEFSDSSTVAGGIDTVTVSGFFLEELLNAITFLDENPVTVEQHIWHPAKRAAWRKIGEFPDVYQDPMGDYYYEDQTGQVVSVDNGRVVSTDGLTKVDYFMPGRVGSSWNVPEDANTFKDSYDYLVRDDQSTLYVDRGSSDPADQFDIDFITDRNDVFYHDEYGQLCIAFGLSEGDANGAFWTSQSRWNKDSGYWEVKEVTVKGPWQRTGTFDTTAENDPVDTCYKWVRMFCGNSMLYAETELTGAPRAIDPSFQLLGDLVHSVLQEEGMSYRLEYNFLTDGFVFSFYRGYDRTQGELEEITSVSSASVPVALDAGSDYPVPDGYTALEHITAQGAQWIGTGVNPTGNTRAVVDGMITAMTSGFQGIVTSRGKSSTNNFSLWAMGKSDSFRDDYGNNDKIEFSEGFNERHTFDKSGGTLRVDGAIKADHESTAFTGSDEITLFAGNTGGTKSEYSYLRMWSCKLYSDSADDSSLVRDMVPARRESDGSIGLYDRVGEKFYANSGTGAFVAGPDIERPVPGSLIYLPNSTTATGETPATAGYVGDSVSVAQCGFTRSDATFITWNTQADGGGTDYAPGSQYLLTGGSDVLYAQWEESEEPEPEPEPEPEGGKAPWVVFSDTWSTIYGYTASRDESNYRNTCYVLYEYDVPDEYDSDGKPKVQITYQAGDTPSDIVGWTVSIPHHTEQGWAVVTVGEDDEQTLETYLDLRDTKPAVDNLWVKDVKSQTYENASGNREQAEADAQSAAAEMVSTEDDGSVPDFEGCYSLFVGGLEKQGIDHLKQNYSTITNLDTGTVDTVGYMIDWDLGDNVEFGVSTVGLALQGRIIAVDEVYESGKVDIRIEIGDKRLGVMDKMRLVR